MEQKKQNHQIPSPIPSPAPFDHHLPPPSRSPAPFDHLLPPPSRSPAAYDHHWQPPKLLTSLYQSQGFIHPAISHQFTFPAHLQNLQDPFRPRSGSLLSLGSTGSSHRPERSPSRESTSSHDSCTRISPLGYMPSPSPSPPNDSILFTFMKKLEDNDKFSANKSEMPVSVRKAAMCVDTRDRYSSGKPYAMEIIQRASTMPSRDHFSQRRYSAHEPFMKRPHDDGPMDLSTKRQRCATIGGYSNIRRFAPRSETVTRSSLAALEPPPPILEPISPPSRAPSRDSMTSQSSTKDESSSLLRAALLGEATSSDISYPSRPASVRSDASGFVCPSPAFSEPSSPSNSIICRLMAGSPFNVDTNQRVCIAKKTLFPVRARVTFWLAKIVEFAKSLPQFSSLDEEDKLLIITSSWAQMLVVYMAEHNFEFAVSPALETAGEDCGPGNLQEPTRIPTQLGVDNIQNFVQRVHTLSLDDSEFTHFKTAVLFQIGNTGMCKKPQIIQTFSGARKSLQKYIMETRSDATKRYSGILHRLGLVRDINSKMIQNLFCKHITSQVNMDDYLKDLLFVNTPVSDANKN